MADQMTPDEMRGRAHSLRVAADKAEESGLAVGDLEMRAFIENVRAGADVLDRLADVIEWAASVPQVEKYPTFAAGWEEAALHVLDLARGETEGTEV